MSSPIFLTIMYCTRCKVEQKDVGKNKKSREEADEHNTIWTVLHAHVTQVSAGFNTRE